jgi:hypothetical protein
MAVEADVAETRGPRASLSQAVKKMKGRIDTVFATRL